MTSFLILPLVKRRVKQYKHMPVRRLCMCLCRVIPCRIDGLMCYFVDLTVDIPVDIPADNLQPVGERKRIAIAIYL